MNTVPIRKTVNKYIRYFLKEHLCMLPEINEIYNDFRLTEEKKSKNSYYQTHVPRGKFEN